jgi:Zn-dependent peptidase ImmA (M78 family)
MTRWVPDHTRRFRRRPHFEPVEIDKECEALVAEFLRRHRGKVEYPLDTNDLIILIEEHVGNLDVYADLSDEGRNVEGVTRFRIGERPDIEIAEILTSEDRRVNRYRTTLAHELGHARLHNPLFQRAFAAGDLFDGRREEKIVCKRETMLEAPQSDWMEWQAGYASGAYLMPRQALAAELRPILDAGSGIPPFRVDDGVADRLIPVVIDRFGVSREAAVVRPLKLNYLTRAERVPTLFG